MTGELWRNASAAAARWHFRHTRRDGKTPYVSHCFRVALTVSHVFGCDDDVCIAIALLHDVIEDTTADYDDVLDGFGAEVADGVAALTKDMRLPEGIREPAYDEQIAAAGWRVKLADVLDNLLDSKKPTKSSIDKCLRVIQIAEQHNGDELGVALANVRKNLAAVRAG